jgi:hypothetical protein
MNHVRIEQNLTRYFEGHKCVHETKYAPTKGARSSVIIWNHIRENVARLGWDNYKVLRKWPEGWLAENGEIYATPKEAIKESNMKISCIDYHSSSARARFAKTGMAIWVNNELVDNFGGYRSDFAAMYKDNVNAFLDSLPFQESREDWEDAAREAHCDIACAITGKDPRNEWLPIIEEAMKKRADMKLFLSNVCGIEGEDE